MSSVPRIQCCRVAKNLVSRCVSRSYIKIKWRKSAGDSRSVTLVLATIVGSKNKSIYLRGFKDVGFNFTHFSNFKFAYFEIEVSFGLVWVNLQNGRFHLQISIFGNWKVLVLSIGFIFAQFLYKGSFGQIWIKITDWSIKVGDCHFGTFFTNYGIPFWI